jgi:lipopolysaccharide transport system permease protein
LGVQPGWGALLFPVIVFLEFLFLWGLALGLSAINVYFRDVQHIMGNVISLWFFLCPIIYPAESVPPQFAFTLWLNPVALFTQMYHIVLLQGGFPSSEMFAAAAAAAVISLVSGNLIFNYYREGFAELI